jgi:hypothetical protein
MAWAFLLLGQYQLENQIDHTWIWLDERRYAFLN